MRAASDRVRVQTKSGEYQRSAVFRRTIWTKQRVASRQRSLQSRPGAPCCARRVGSDRAARRVRSRRTPLVLRRLNALAGHHERPHRSHPTMQGSSPNSPPPEVKQVTLTVLRNSTTHRDVTQLLTTPPVFRHDFTSRRHSSRVTRHASRVTSVRFDIVESTRRQLQLRWAGMCAKRYSTTAHYRLARSSWKHSQVA